MIECRMQDATETELREIRQVAAQGDEECSLWLGHYYASSPSLEGIAESRMWLEIAAQRGNSDAVICLAGLTATEAGMRGLSGENVDSDAVVNEVAGLLALAELLGANLSELPPDTWLHVSRNRIESKQAAASIWLNRKTN